jgi:hypothetical protein
MWWNPSCEDLMPILRPLYATSWLIEDFLRENNHFGAQDVIISSASSKTSYALAF